MLNQLQQVAAWQAVCETHSVQSLLHNAQDIEMRFLHHGDFGLPVSVCHSAQGQTWVASPLSMYADYAQEETSRHMPRLASASVNAILSGLETWLKRANFAHAAMLNNWLVSTNLYPSLHTESVERLMAQALQRFPHHALWWRSLNPHHHADWLQYLQQQGFLLLPSRRIYLLDQPHTAKQRLSNWRKDVRLLRQSPVHALEAADFAAPEVCEQALRLYQQLYTDKYSLLNPQYTLTWLQAMQHSGLLHVQGLRHHNGDLVSVAGSLTNHRHLVTPFLGFDTHAPKQCGYYRMASLMATDLAIALNKDMNRSAGAGHFKRQRGAHAMMEYSAVYVRHLPKRQQQAHELVRLLCARVGKPLMEWLDV